MSDAPRPTLAQLLLPLAQPFATLVAVGLGVLLLTQYFGLDLKKLSLSGPGFNAELAQRIEATQDKVDKSSSTAGTELNDLTERVRQLEARLKAAEPAPSAVQPPSPPTVPDAGTSTQRTAAELAPLFQKLPNRVSPLYNREGYIFLGNLASGAIDDPNLRGNGELVRRLADFRVGTAYTAAAHLSLRGGYPGDNPSYYVGVPSLGVVTNGLSVVLLEPPKQAVRPSGLVQIWAKVRVAE